jgi:hypothetical protein
METVSQKFDPSNRNYCFYGLHVKHTIEGKKEGLSSPEKPLFVDTKWMVIMIKNGSYKRPHFV